MYNEMKGVYSSPDSVNGRVTQTALFPDNSYAKDSGGDPRVIPELTFEEFRVSLALLITALLIIEALSFMVLVYMSWKTARTTCCMHLCGFAQV